MQEPIYDPERLKTDKAYRFHITAEFVAYMEQIPTYGECVTYYMRMCEVLGIEPTMLNAGSNLIPEREASYDGQRFTDAGGNTIASIRWGIPERADCDSRVRNKLFFERYYLPNITSPLGVRIQPFEERKATFAARVQQHEYPELFRQSELRTVTNTLEEYQKKIKDWKPGYAYPDVIEHYGKITTLVEDEVIGSEPIKWGRITNSLQLQPFALVWDAVKYKLFLEQWYPTPTNVPDTSTTDNDSSNTGQGAKKPIRKTLAECFEHHSRYVTVMGLLADNGYCDPISGNATAKINKQLLCGLIESLHVLGYYGKTAKPSEAETILIALNTFGVEVSKSIVKKRIKDSTLWSFIPSVRTK